MMYSKGILPYTLVVLLFVATASAVSRARYEVHSGEWAVKLSKGVDANTFAANLGLINRGQIATLEGYYLFEDSDVKEHSRKEIKAIEEVAHYDAEEERTVTVRSVEEIEARKNVVDQQLSQFKEVEWSAPQTRKLNQLRSTSSKKRAYATPADPAYNSQWHLHGLPGVDINVVPVWTQSKFGDGSVIAVVDDGLDATHPDITARFSSALSWDFNNNDPDPSTDGQPSHGTGCAGLAVGSTNNVCGVGVAYGATVAGLRLLSAAQTDAEQATALTYKSDQIDIYSNSWGPTDGGLWREGPGPLLEAAMLQSSVQGRGGKGSIYVWAAGNGGDADNCNYDGFASNRVAIAVAGLGHDGTYAYFSEACAAITVTAPAGSGGGDIVTIDLVGAEGYNTDPSDPGCMSEFDGTSASAPMVAGVIALMLQTNSSLSARDVRAILIDTARIVDGRSDWITNGGGYKYHPHYGFGLVDATGAVNKAAEWAGLPDMQVVALPTIMVNTAIKNDDSRHPVVSSIYVNATDTLVIEHAEVIVNIDDGSTGDLRIILESPWGTQSILSDINNVNQAYWIPEITCNTQCGTSGFAIQEAITSLWTQNVDSSDLPTLPIVEASPSTACSGVANGAQLSGNVALVYASASCSYAQQVQYIQDAGAAAVIVVQQDGALLDAMDGSLSIPAVLVTWGDGQNLASRLSDGVKAQFHNQALRGSFVNWRFTSLAHYGEHSIGEWKLIVADLGGSSRSGTFQNWQLTFYTHDSGLPPPPFSASNMLSPLISWMSIFICIFCLFVYV